MKQVPAILKDTYLLFRRYFFILISISLLLSSCKKENTKPGIIASEVSYTNVTYGSDTHQVMDIFLPEGRNIEHTRTIFVIHGGGWTEGDKKDMRDMVNFLKTQFPNYAFVNLNYRLAYNNQTNVFPAQEEDVKNAVDFYLNKSEEYLVSKDLVMGGASAGAHLAMLHSYKNDPERRVKAVVDFYGPTDLPTLWNTGIIQQWILFSAIGKSYPDATDRYTNSSPLHYITRQSPPTIALQGGADMLVPPNQSQLLINALVEQGVKCELVFYPSESHGWVGANLLDSYQKLIAFIRDHVK